MSDMVCRIAITSGEPAGIGPDLCIQLAQQSHPQQLIVIGDPDLFRDRARQLDLPVTIQHYDNQLAAQPAQAGTLLVYPVQLKTTVTAGRLDPDNAAYVISTLDVAIDGSLSGEFDAMVTAPLHKGVINDAGMAFSGHTEYLQQRCQSPQTVMMLCAGNLRVALTTTHLPLSAVSQAITSDRLKAVIRVLHQDLQKYFALPKPRILVCGLNPHAGEGGHLGREELDIIIPALDSLRAEGIQLQGPIPADTAFTPESLQAADVVLSMFHDQGLPVLKAQGFGEAVNITLGLPIIRTSVDHGTALHLAGSGEARTGSLITALSYAVEMSCAAKQQTIDSVA